jgi:tetratricopeptide (TPR) repeat protein
MNRRLTIILIGAALAVCLCGVATGVLVWHFVFPRIAKDFRAWQAKQRAYEAADRLKQDMDSRELLVPSEAIPSFRSDAVVVLAYLGRKELGTEAKWPRVGFVVGDGTLILTAAHCVLDFNEQGQQAVSLDTVVVSPYYGDVFEFKILAVDKDADLAILKAPWSSHPVLALASQSELETAKEVLVAGYPQPDKSVHPHRFAKQVRMEKLPVQRLDESQRNMAIQLRGARFGGPGWSGSALVLPKTGKAVGVLTMLSWQTMKTSTNDNVFIKRDLSGCSVKSIHALLQKQGLTNSAYSPSPQMQTIADGSQAFSLAMEYVDEFWNKDLSRSLAIAEQLVELRSNSVQARLFLAWSAHAVSVVEAKRQELVALAELSFKAAVHLSPGSASAHAGYGNFLMFRERYEEALAEIGTALAIEPRNELALVNRLRILTRTSPQKAVEFGQELTEKHADNSHFWFWFSDALSGVGRQEQALEAAQKAVKLNPDGVYRGRLADALAQVGRLDDAEKQYKKMTADCGCQSCWVRHADFLLEHREDKLDEARQSVETAEAKTWRRVSEANLKNLRIKLDLAPLRLLAEKSPKEAEALGRQMVENSPTNGHYWFEMAGILRTLGKHEAAVEAAQRAVNLSPDASYQPRLANTLAKAGRLDESEQTYKKMLRDHPDRPNYWFWYAKFLQDYHPQRIEDARAAFAKAQSPSPNWSVPAGELESLRVKLEMEKATTKPPESGAH